MLLPKYYYSTVTRKGQTTIPIELREHLGIKEGDRLVWTLSDGMISVTTAREHARRTSRLLKTSIDQEVTSPSLDEMETAIEHAVTDRYAQAASKR